MGSRPSKNLCALNQGIGTFVVSQQAARRVRTGGAIINFSTTVTKLVLPTYAAYAATNTDLRPPSRRRRTHRVRWDALGDKVRRDFHARIELADLLSRTDGT